MIGNVIHEAMDPHRLEDLSRFVTAINQIQTQKEVISYLTKNLETLIEGDSRQILSVVPNEPHLKLIYIDGTPSYQNTNSIIKLRDSMSLIRIMAGKVIILNSEEHPDETAGFSCVLNAPVMMNGELFALIKIGRYSAGDFTENDIAIMNTVASVVSACLTQSQQLTDQYNTNRRAEINANRLQSLADISLKLSSVKNSEALFHTICETISDLFLTNRISYVDVKSDGSKHQLRVKHTYLDGDFSSNSYIIEKNTPALQKVIQTRRVHYDSNLSKTEAADHGFSSAFNLRTTWSIPISYNGNVVGILNAGSRSTPDYEGNLFGLLSMLGSLISATYARIEANKLLKRRAHYDAMTNIHNRYSFQKILDALFHNHPDKYLTLFVIDLDHFKEINDFYGHQTGDKVLIHLAKKLEAICNKHVCVARIGGDEFSMIVIDDSPVRKNYEIILNKLNHLNLIVAVEPHILEFQCSIGSTLYPENAKSKEELIKQADLALYEAKLEPSKGIMAYSPVLYKKYITKISKRQRIEEGLGQNEFTVFYQPIVDIKTGRVRTLEALARWQHPEKGLLSPAHFTQAFHEPTLCMDLGRMVIDTVTKDMARWRDDKLPINRVNINVESANLSDPAFPLFLLNKIEKRNLRPRDFIVEITENSVVKSQSSDVLKRLEVLNKAGILIALDDFGTGYSSITHLKELPISILKMDRSYVQSITTNNIDRQIVKSLIELARCLDIYCVAEGIETAQERDAVLSLGCKIGQGYFFARPTPSQEIPDLIARMNGTPSDITLIPKQMRYN